MSNLSKNLLNKQQKAIRLERYIIWLLNLIIIMQSDTHIYIYICESFIYMRVELSEKLYESVFIIILLLIFVVKKSYKIRVLF